MKKILVFLIAAGVFCTAAAQGNDKAEPQSRLHFATCQLDGIEELTWPSPEEIAARETGARDPATKEYLLHNKGLQAPPGPTPAANSPKEQPVVKISWAKARQMILRGYVTRIFQAHDKAIQIVTDKGSVYSAKQNTIDEFYVAVSVVDPCHRYIDIVTE